MLQRVSNRLPAIAGGLGAASLVVGLGAYLVTGQFDRQVLILLEESQQEQGDNGGDVDHAPPAEGSHASEVTVLAR